MRPKPSSPARPRPLLTSRRLIVGGVLTLGVLLTALVFLLRSRPERVIRLEHEGHQPLDVVGEILRYKSSPSRVLAADESVLAEVELFRCKPVGLHQLPWQVTQVFELAEAEGSCLEGGSLNPLLLALDHDLRHLTDETLLEQRCARVREALFAPEPLRTPLGFAVGAQKWLPLHDRPTLLEAYLNLVSFGEEDYGIEAAAQTWFGKGAAELSLGEAAYLAVRATHPEYWESSSALRKARDQLLEQMLEQGAATPEGVRDAREVSIPSRPRRSNALASLPDYVHRAIDEALPHMDGLGIARAGVDILTPFEPELQKTAARSVERIMQMWRRNRKKEAAQMAELLAAEPPTDEGPVEVELPPGAWTSPPTDKDQPAFSLMAMEPRTGRVKVLYERCNDCRSQRNGVFYRKRQPGSAWKPFVYATALEQGMTQVMSLPDKPFTYEVKGETWKPKNHEEKYYGQVLVRRALALSLNSIAIQLIFRSKPEKVVSLAHRLGITSRIRPVPALALGTSPVTLAEMVEGYSVFASGGYRTRARFVDQVKARGGQVLYTVGLDPAEPVLDPRVAFVMTDMMREVTQHGTAWPARRLKFPVAGKTGTTNESRDAWFVGFSNNLVAGTWVGFEAGRGADTKTLGGHETGGSLALPVWMDVMSAAAKKEPPGEFTPPPGIVMQVRSPWGGHLHPEGREMAFIGDDARVCHEVAPAFAAPEKESDSQRASRMDRYYRYKRGGSAGYRCPWVPVAEKDRRANGT